MKIAHTNTASPSDPGNNFSSFGNPSISGGTVAFHAQTPGFRPTDILDGIYSYDGASLHIVAGRNSLPGPNPKGHSGLKG